MEEEESDVLVAKGEEGGDALQTTCMGLSLSKIKYAIHFNIYFMKNGQCMLTTCNLYMKL